MTGTQSSLPNHFHLSLDALDSNSRSPISTHSTPKSPLKKSNGESCRFTRELEQRLQNGLFSILLFPKEFLRSIQTGDVSEEAKHAYNLLIDGRIDSSSEPSHCTSEGDLSSQQHEGETNSKPSQVPPPPPPTALFSSSSSSSASISTSSTSNNTQSSSSNQQKSDRHSHYSSTSTDNDISLDLKPQNELSPLK